MAPTATHLRGTGSPDVLANGCPLLDVDHTPTAMLEGVQILQVIFEVSSSTFQDVLPPSLHPSIPGHVAWQVWKVPDSPAGPFAMALCRIGARLGIKPRTLATRVVVDSVGAARWLEEGWGYSTVIGEVALRPNYDMIHGEVRVDGEVVLDMELRDPGNFAGGSIRYAANLNFVHTDRGLRLAQLDADYVFHRVERGKAVLHRFDGAAFNAPLLAPSWPVVGTLATVDVTLHEVRFIADPYQLAADGTEDLRPKDLTITNKG